MAGGLKTSGRKEILVSNFSPSLIASVVESYVKVLSNSLATNSFLMGGEEIVGCVVSRSHHDVLSRTERCEDV